MSMISLSEYHSELGGKIKGSEGSELKEMGTCNSG